MHSHPQARQVSNGTQELPTEKKAEKEDEWREETVRGSKRECVAAGSRVCVQDAQRDQGLGGGHDEPGGLGLPPPP